MAKSGLVPDYLESVSNVEDKKKYRPRTLRMNSEFVLAISVFSRWLASYVYHQPMPPTHTHIPFLLLHNSRKGVCVCVHVRGRRGAWADDTYSLA